MRRYLTLLPLALMLAACNINTPDATPTVEVLVTETPTGEASATPTLSATPSMTPSVTLTQAIVMLTPVEISTQPPIPNAGPPTVPPALPTEGPYEYVIQAGDDLAGILNRQPWGYNGFDQAIQRAVVQLNNMLSPDILPAVGSTLLIPRRTPTPIPIGNELTQAAMPDGLVQCGENFACVPGQVFGPYKVEEGDTIIEIAEIYNTSLEMLSALNPNLNWGQCNFTEISGGPNCNPLISVGQDIQVPLPTPVPSSTPTFTGSETPTATPTYAPARLVYPPDGAISPPGVFTLQWVSAGILKPNEAYLVEVQDTTLGGEPWRQITRDTSISLPANLIPTDGQTHQFQWRVTVARRDDSGAISYAGGQGAWRGFQWQSR
jgi:hypothetical protein